MAFWEIEVQFVSMRQVIMISNRICEFTKRKSGFSRKKKITVYLEDTDSSSKMSVLLKYQ